MSEISPARKWGALIVLSLALAIIIIDTTILNVSLATIIREFKTTIQSIQWVITAYALTLTALTITGGRLGDFFGRKRMFILGAVIFAIGSAITSFSHNVTTLIWGEAIIEGIGAALMMPATSALLVTTFKGRERAVAFGVWGGVAAAAASIGPIVGGYFTTYHSWRWGFRINILVAAILVISSMIIQEAKETEERPSLDYLGIILSVLGLVGVVFGIIEASQYGWWLAKEKFIAFGHVLNFGQLSVVPYSILLGLIFLGLFIAWEANVTKRNGTPLVSLELFKNRQFSSAIVTATLLSLGLAGLTFAIPVFLESVRNLDALHTGVAFLPMSLTLLVVAPITGYFSHYVKPRTLIQTGLIIDTIAFLLLRSEINIHSGVASLAPGLIVFGLGMGIVIAQVSNIALSAVSPQQSGEASGINNTMRQLGSTLGSAILGSILLTTLTASLTTGVTNSSTIPTHLKPALSQAVSAQASAIEFGSGIHLGNQISPAINKEVVAIGHQATVDGDKRTFGFSALFMLLGLLASFWVPDNKKVETDVALTCPSTKATAWLQDILLKKPQNKEQSVS